MPEAKLHSGVNAQGIYLHKWLVPILLGLFVAATAAWTGLLIQTSNALPRVEASVTYVSKVDYLSDMTRRELRLVRIEDKIDRLLNRSAER